VNEERTGKCLRQVDHIRGHLWQIFQNSQPSHGGDHTIFEVMTEHNPFKWGSCYSIFTFMCMFCRSLFVLLYFFFWPLCCLFFFDIRILITPLVSSNSSFSAFVVCRRISSIFYAHSFLLKSYFNGLQLNIGSYVKMNLMIKCINHYINFTLLYHAPFLTKPCTLLTECMVLIVCILNLAQVIKVFLYFANPTECTHIHVQYAYYQCSVKFPCTFFSYWRFNIHSIILGCYLVYWSNICAKETIIKAYLIFIVNMGK
jgi:hypothetical protein